MKQQTKIHTLVECAQMIVIGTVLMMVKLYSLPNGGSVTLVSMLPFVLVSFRHGTVFGVATGFVSALLQMLTSFYPPPTGTLLAFIGVILLDYVLAFAVLGLASACARPFPNRTVGVAVGTAAVCILRFLCSFVSGFLIWGSLTEDGLGAVTYSLTYNASYMLPETILTVVVAVLLYRTAPRLFDRQENK